MSIYQQLLGDAFHSLSPTLQRVHGESTHVQAEGLVRVTYGNGWLVPLINRLGKVPRASHGTPLSLRIQRTPSKEVWIRSFDGVPLVTEQWIQEGLFVEAVGRTRMFMQLEIKDGTLLFHPKAVRFAGLSIPPWLAIRVSAVVSSADNGWNIVVETSSGILGMLFKYEGFIKLVE